MKTTIIAACATIAQPLAALNVYGANASPSPSPSPSPSSMSAPQNGAWLDITLKLLDWPFLLLVVVLVIVFLFRRQLTALFNRGDILISWGEGRSIRLRELADKIDQEIDPLRDDVEALKETAPKAHLQARSSMAQPSEKPLTTKADALRVMKDALANPKFRWRNVDRLAAIACLPESEASELLRSDPDIVFGIGKSMKSIARLRSR